MSESTRGPAVQHCETMAEVRALAVAYGAPPAIAEATRRAMIAASIAFEHAEFARQHGKERP